MSDVLIDLGQYRERPHGAYMFQHDRQGDRVSRPLRDEIGPAGRCFPTQERIVSLQSEEHAMTLLISYIRVSTVGQGKSGLGLEAQRQAIARFAAVEGFEIVVEHVEVETGKGADALCAAALDQLAVGFPRPQFGVVASRTQPGA